jgi:hypothetical protein
MSVGLFNNDKHWQERAQEARVHAEQLGCELSHRMTVITVARKNRHIEMAINSIYQAALGAPYGKNTEKAGLLEYPPSRDATMVLPSDTEGGPPSAARLRLERQISGDRGDSDAASRDCRSRSMSRRSSAARMGRDL